MNREPHTYTPGHARAKELVFCIGLAFVALGLGQITPPTSAIFAGRTSAGTVTRTEQLPGEIQEFAYAVEFTERSGQVRTATLSFRSTRKALFRPGDPLRLAYSADFERVIPVSDLSTWAPGILFILFGGALSVSFALLRARARVSIALPEGTPPFPGSSWGNR